LSLGNKKTRLIAQTGFEYCWIYTITISPRERVEKDMVVV